jgi:hypothetical protein
MDENHRVLELSATALARVYAQTSTPGWRLDVCDVRHGDIVHMELSRVATNLVEAAEDLYTALCNIENDDGHIPEPLWEEILAARAKAEGRA